MARVVITGGCGFLGQLVGRALLRKGQILTHTAQIGHETVTPIEKIVLADVRRPETFLPGFEDLQSAAEVRLGDISDAQFCESLCADNGDRPLSIFHLGAIMSGQGEADFDTCLAVNLRGTLQLLEAARHSGASRPRFVLASAGATLGSGTPTDFIGKGDVVSDSTRATPHTTYGMTKACSE